MVIISNDILVFDEEREAVWSCKQVQDHRQINQMWRYFNTFHVQQSRSAQKERIKTVWSFQMHCRQLFHIHVFNKQADAIWQAKYAAKIIFSAFLYATLLDAEIKCSSAALRHSFIRFSFIRISSIYAITF